MDYERFILKQVEWRGEVTIQLENIIKNQEETRDDIKVIKKQLTSQAIKVGVIGGVMGLLSGTVIGILLNTIFV